MDVLDCYSQLVDREVSLYVFRTLRKLEEVEEKSMIDQQIDLRDSIFLGMLLSQSFSSVDDVQVFFQAWPQCRRWMEEIIKNHDENYLLSLLWTIQHAIHLH